MEVYGQPPNERDKPSLGSVKDVHEGETDKSNRKLVSSAVMVRAAIIVVSPGVVLLKPH